jgi:ACR3 family arsenite efflux pump ArsB
MMYPVPAKVRYDRLGTVTRDRRLVWPSLVLRAGPVRVAISAEDRQGLRGWFVRHAV